MTESSLLSANKSDLSSLLGLAGICLQLLQRKVLLIFSLLWVEVAFNLVHQMLFYFIFFVRYFLCRISYMSEWENKHKKTDSTVYSVFLVFSAFWQKHRKSFFQFKSVKVGAGPCSCFLIRTCPESVPRLCPPKHRRSNTFSQVQPFWCFFHACLSFLLQAVL